MVMSKINPLSTKIFLMSKRISYLSWEDYFMATALLASKRSKDPVTQVGCCIVNNDNKIIAIGYNGMPIGIPDDHLPWGKGSSDPLENKYFYVCHAELNAILNKNSSTVEGCTLYTTHFPCNECAKVIIQSRIASIVYLNDPKPQDPKIVASKRLIEYSKITLRKFLSNQEKIVLNFSHEDNENDKFYTF